MKLETWGDEGELHVAWGWCRAAVICKEARRYVLGQVGAAYVDEYTGEIKPENVKRGWAMEIPERHPLDHSRDGSIIVTARLFPPFAITSGPWKKHKHILLGRPATWLYDH